MTNEEMQSTMEFILEQQAQYAARIQRDESRLTRLEDAFVTLVQMAKLTDDRIDGLLESSRLLAQSQSQNDARLAQLTEKMTELAQTQAHSDDRLRALINVVDRYITRGGNGNTGK